MLVLSRKPNEKVVIDGGITITVAEVNGGRVRIGIEAPADVTILRGELITGREETCRSVCLAAKSVQSSERDVNGGQMGTDAGSGLLPEPLLAAAIKNPLRRLRRIPH